MNTTCALEIQSLSASYHVSLHVNPDEVSFDQIVCFLFIDVTLLQRCKSLVYNNSLIGQMYKKNILNNLFAKIF